MQAMLKDKIMVQNYYFVSWKNIGLLLATIIILIIALSVNTIILIEGNVSLIVSYRPTLFSRTISF